MRLTTCPFSKKPGPEFPVSSATGPTFSCARGRRAWGSGTKPPLRRCAIRRIELCRDPGEAVVAELRRHTIRVIDGGRRAGADAGKIVARHDEAVAAVGETFFAIVDDLQVW